MTILPEQTYHLEKWTGRKWEISLTGVRPETPIGPGYRIVTVQSVNGVVVSRHCRQCGETTSRCQCARN